MKPKFSLEQMAKAIRAESAGKGVTKAVEEQGLMHCAKSSCQALEAAQGKGVRPVIS